MEESKASTALVPERKPGTPLALAAANKSGSGDSDGAGTFATELLADRKSTKSTKVMVSPVIDCVDPGGNQPNSRAIARKRARCKPGDIGVLVLAPPSEEVS